MPMIVRVRALVLVLFPGGYHKSGIGLLIFESELFDLLVASGAM